MDPIAFYEPVVKSTYEQAEEESASTAHAFPVVTTFRSFEETTTTPVPTVVHHFGGSSSSGSDYDDYNGAEYQNEIDEYEVREKYLVQTSLQNHNTT